MITKRLFLPLAVCAALLAACSNDDGTREIPKFTPNNTDISVTAAGGEKTITVSNASELNITQINDKTTSGSTTTDTNVYSISNGKLKDSKNVTEAGWFTATVVQDNGAYRKIVFTVTANTSTESARDKYIHVDCGSNLYGLSLHLTQVKATASSSN